MRKSRKRMSRKRMSRKRKKQTSRKKLYKMHQSYSDTYDISRRFLNAIKNGDANEVKQLLQLGEFDINSEFSLGSCFMPCLHGDGPVKVIPIIYASELKQPEIVEILLNHGANPNIKRNKDNYNPLLAAAIEGCLSNMKLLLKYGANPNIQDEEGLTPLMASVNEGYPSQVQLLLDRGADPNISDLYHATPMSIIMERIQYVDLGILGQSQRRTDNLRIDHEIMSLLQKKITENKIKQSRRAISNKLFTLKKLVEHKRAFPEVSTWKHDYTTLPKKHSKLFSYIRHFLDLPDDLQAKIMSTYFNLGQY